MAPFVSSSSLHPPLMLSKLRLPHMDPFIIKKHLAKNHLLFSKLHDEVILD